jgi:hypothetical protein
MKAIFKTIALTTLMAISGLWTANQPGINLAANTQVTVKLVLGEGATLQGYTPSNDPSIFHHQVVTYTAQADSLLPIPQKPGTTFVSWVFAQASALVRVGRMPKTSGAVYYAYWQGDGSLATTISQSSSVPNTSVPSTPTSIYLKANNAPVNWPLAEAVIRIYFWEAPITVTWPGEQMVNLGDGLYRYDFGFTPTKLLFVRQNPNNAAEIWNQTGDLTYTTPNNLFTLTSWDGGVWSPYSAGSTSSEVVSSSITSSDSTPPSTSTVTSSIPPTTSSEPPSPSSSEVIISSEVPSSSQPSTSTPTSSEPLSFSLYLFVNHPTVNWGEAGATFAIYYWGNGLDANPWPGKAMTNIGNGYYRFTFLNIEPTHLLFVRLNPANGEVWNQTIDYGYPGADYLLTIDNWGSGATANKSTGTWTPYSA